MAGGPRIPGRVLSKLDHRLRAVTVNGEPSGGTGAQGALVALAALAAPWYAL